MAIPTLSAMPVSDMPMLPDSPMLPDLPIVLDMPMPTVGDCVGDTVGLDVGAQDGDWVGGMQFPHTARHNSLYAGVPQLAAEVGV
jgi:hypothetical protein